MTAKAKKLLSYLFKLAILVLVFYYVYHRILKNNDNLHNFSTLVANIPRFNVVSVLLLIVLLMLLNWLLEALKWWYLARELNPISVWLAIESVFCGLTWAIFTPNRLGEYGGRVMFLPPRKRIHGVFAMAVGAFGQLAVTIILGAAASVWFVYSFLNFNFWLSLGLTVAAIILIVFILLFYFNIKWMVYLLNKVIILRKFHRFFDIMGKYSFTELLNIMYFCLGRFFVFTFQYYLIIHLLIPQISFVTLAMFMFVFFFVQSALPSLDFVDLGVRNYTAITLFGFITDKTIAVVVAVSFIYIVNLLIPALLGSIFVLKLKFFDRAY